MHPFLFRAIRMEEKIKEEEEERREAERWPSDSV